jgi:DNA primase
MSDFAQTVKQQADIVKVIEGYIRLRNAGAQRFKGLCPFHKEKTPSFNVNGGSQQFFYCFGCQASGDVFSFVGKIENVTFPEAVRIVAQKCGIPLPKREFSSPEEAVEARLRTKLLDLHETAATWFEEQMRGPEGALAREYLAGRGLSDEGIKKFRIGYAPDSFNALRDRLSGMADEATLRASGLFSSKEQEDGGHGRIYDRFRKRVVFPICNEGGRVIAFTARTLGVAAEGEKAGPKYVNSPETPLYSKGQVLFNLDKAKSAIRTVGFALLVEGQMDCISVFLRGIQNVIATSGTAFTEQQVAILRRHTANVIVNFDPDAAGANAAEKSISLLTEEGFTIKLVTLDGGLDPDRFIRERGVDAYKEAIRGARRQSDYLIARAMVQFPGGSAEQKVKQISFLLSHMQRMPQRQSRIDFARDASALLHIDSAVLRAELDRAARHRLGAVEGRIAQDVANLPKDFVAAAQVLREQVIEAAATGRSGAVNRGSRLSEVDHVLLRALASTDIEEVETRHLAAKAIQEKPSWFEHLVTFPTLQTLSAREARDPMEVVDDPLQKGLLAEALFRETRLTVEGALQELEERAIESQLRELRAQIAEAERRGDYAELAVLTQQKLDLDRALRGLHRQNGNSV